jgi:dTDP-D-glucose 4,6-dehydratase
VELDLLALMLRQFVTKHPEYKIYNLDALTYAGNLENLKDIESLANYTLSRVILLMKILSIRFSLASL